jgi:predicted Rossmann fold flavoprotein
MSTIYDTAILGAGASGLMASSILQGRNILIDANPKAGVRVSISGGGRCNFTNLKLGADNYRGDATFISEVLSGFDNRDSRKWFASRGLKSVVRGDGQLFCAGRAEELLSILQRESRNVSRLFSADIESVTLQRGLFTTKTSAGVVVSRRVLLALGGASYPKIGGGMRGLEIARAMGHDIAPAAPALTGFTLQPPQFFMKELSGISIPVVLTVAERVYSGDMLFAHRGISGPVIFNASLRWERGEISLNMIPGFDLKSMRGSGKRLSTLLPLPTRLSKALLSHLKIEDIPAKRMDAKSLDRLSVLREYRFAPAGTFGYSRAEVMRGGVDTDMVDPSTMMSRVVKGLYFAGEVLDVTGELGGYNLQWAFSSAVRAAESINREIGVG